MDRGTRCWPLFTYKAGFLTDEGFVTPLDPIEQPFEAFFCISSPFVTLLRSARSENIPEDMWHTWIEIEPCIDAILLQNISVNEALIP